MEPDHDRPLLAVVDARRPNIEVLAIIVHSEAAGRFFSGRIGERAHFLRRNGAVVHGQLRPLPGRHGLSRFKAFFRFSIRDAVVRIDSLADIALDPAACRLDDGNARPGKPLSQQTALPPGIGRQPSSPAVEPQPVRPPVSGDKQDRPSGRPVPSESICDS